MYINKTVLVLLVLFNYFITDSQNISIQNNYFSLGDTKFYICRDSNRRYCDTSFYLNKFIAIFGQGSWDSWINFKKLKKKGNYVVDYNYISKGISLEVTASGKEIRNNPLVQALVIYYTNEEVSISHDVSIFDYRFNTPPKYEEILNSNQLKQYISPRLKEIDEKKLDSDNFKELGLLTPSDISIELTFKREGNDFYLFKIVVFQFS